MTQKQRRAALKNVTETDAATAFARSWNRMNSCLFNVPLAPDVRLYNFQSKKTYGGSQNLVAAYLIIVMDHVRAAATEDPAYKVKAKLGAVAWCGRKRLCTILSARRYRETLVVFDMREGRVARIMIRNANGLDTSSYELFPI